ncbi:hypothetical protein DFP73DRAFT_552232, partial [Morchella snyderi]
MAFPPVSRFSFFFLFNYSFYYFLLVYLELGIWNLKGRMSVLVLCRQTHTSLFFECVLFVYWVVN